MSKISRVDSLKDYFSRVFVYQSKIDANKNRIKELRYVLESPSSASFGVRVQEMRKFDRIENIVAKITQLEEEIKAYSLKLLKLEEEIVLLGNILESPLQKAVIIWRYICKLPWEEISDRAELSEMKLFREHRSALQVMAGVMPCLRLAS